MHQIFLTSFEDLWKTMKRSSMVFPCPTYCLSSLIVVQFTNCELPWRTCAPGPGSYPSQRKYDTHHVMRWYVLYWAWGSTVESSWLTRSIKISLVLWYSSLSDHVHLDLHWYLKLWQPYSWNLGVQVPETVKHVPPIEISDPCDSNQEWLLVFVLVCGLLR